jgi:YesN/AraC family two-component response regulator
MAEHENYFLNKGVNDGIEAQFGEDIILFNNIKVLFGMPEPFDAMNYATSIGCKRGKLTATINLNEITLNADNIMVLLPGDKVQLKTISDDFIGYAVSIDKKYINNLYITASQTMSLFLQFKKSPIIKMDKETWELMDSHYAILRKVVRMHNSHYRYEIIQNLMSAFCLIDIDSIYNNNDNDTSQRMQEIFDKFYNLVRIYYKESRKVVFYADKLCITPKYLSATVKKCTGRSANDWIYDYILAEAKRLIKTTDLSVVEISNQLGFNNQSFFGKFFKQRTGTTPYRFKLM